MKKILFQAVVVFLFSLVLLSAQESEDDFLNRIESAISEAASGSEISDPYNEGIDDNSVRVYRDRQTDDSIDAPYAEKEVSSTAVQKNLEDVSEQGFERVSDSFDDSLSENSEMSVNSEIKDEKRAVDSDQIVQSIYGVKNTEPADDEYGDDILTIQVKIPPKQNPKSADGEKLAAAKKRDEDEREFKGNMETLNLGTPSEINGVVDKIVDDDDPRYIDVLYELFYKTSSNDVRSRILDYFAKNEDPCLSDYAVEIIDDPYDTSNAFVSKCMEYVSTVKCKEAAPALVKLLESEKEEYFNAALSALGKTGGKKEAKYLAKYLERDDLDVPVRQALMRTLGQMNAVETWDQVVEIAQNEDENDFVRQYAAEALGNMKKEESIPVLISLYENGNPNMREYCIKGLLNFPESEKARNMILQGIRDEHVKVRLQSIKACREMKLKDAVPYLIYRAKNDNENSVKKEVYPVLAELNTKEGNEFLIERITDTKVPDSAKNMAAEALLKFSKNIGISEINELAKNIVDDDRRKSLRKSLGKFMAKYEHPEFGEVCSMYISSKDTDTCTIGIDMYRTGRYPEAKDALLKVAESKSGNAGNRKRAKQILGIEDEPPSK